MRSEIENGLLIAERRGTLGSASLRGLAKAKAPRLVRKGSAVVGCPPYFYVCVSSGCAKVIVELDFSVLNLSNDFGGRPVLRRRDGSPIFFEIFLPRDIDRPHIFVIEAETTEGKKEK
jgi:hypothetical protein